MWTLIAPPHGDVPERGGQMRLADADRPEHQGPVGGVEEAQGDQFVPQLLVVADLRRSRPSVSSRMAGSRPAARARSEAELASRRVTSSARRSSRKSAWASCCWRARCEPFGQGVEQLAQLERAQELLELAADRVGQRLGSWWPSARLLPVTSGSAGSAGCASALWTRRR